MIALANILIIIISACLIAPRIDQGKRPHSPKVRRYLDGEVSVLKKSVSLKGA